MVGDVFGAFCLVSALVLIIFLVHQVVNLVLRLTGEKNVHVRLSKAERGLLRVSKLWRTDRRWSEDMRPRGRPLYKRLLNPWFGLAIYGNGIKGRWCFIDEVRTRFVPFSLISSVYEVKLSIGRFGPHSEALQVETFDYETLVIPSDVHDTKEVLRILEGAMGSGWKDVHREDELTGRVYFTDEDLHTVGDVFKPALVRYRKRGRYRSDGWGSSKEVD